VDSLTVARYVVFALFALSVVIAGASWLVRSRTVSPFSALGRGLRSATDFVLDPVEARLVRMGGNPAHAGGWLVVVVAVAGVVFLSLLGWFQDSLANVRWAAAGGPRQVAATTVQVVHKVLFIALIVRVVGSWLGWFRYNRWMRPFYALTDWLVEPIRRVLPSYGPYDLSPLVAIFVLWVLKTLLLMGLS
jgi:YggT family protein